MAKDPDILIDLTTAASAFEAEVIANALEAHGVPARAFAGAGNVSHHEVAGSQPYRVQVRRRDLEHARSLLDEIRRAHAAIDWDTVDVGEMEDTQQRTSSESITSQTVMPTDSSRGRPTSPARGNPFQPPRVTPIATHPFESTAHSLQSRIVIWFLFVFGIVTIAAIASQLW